MRSFLNAVEEEKRMRKKITGWPKGIPPQEIRDAICVYAGSEKVCVALIASAFVRKIFSRERRAFFVQKLSDFLTGDVARRGGMGSRDEPGPIGWWEISEGNSKRFVGGVCDAVVIDFHHSDLHYDNHHWMYGEAPSGPAALEALDEDGEDREAVDPILAETLSCLELHVPCILAFGGYVTDHGLNVTGRRRTFPVRHKGQLDICSAMDVVHTLSVS